MSRFAKNSNQLDPTPAAAVPDITPRRRRGRFAAAAASVLSGAVLLTGTAIAPAHASQNNYEFDTFCESNHTIQTWAPDLTRDEGWTVIWAAVLYKWTASGWQRYSSSPTNTENGGDWIVQSYTWTHLPTGYWQVRDAYSWLYNGKQTGAYSALGVTTHKLDGTSYYYGASAATASYSTASYCYMS